jgi:hypothetical protein
MPGKINHQILDTILGFLGVKNVQACCDQPEATIQLRFVQWGEPKCLDLTCQQIVDAITEGPIRDAAGPPARKSEAIRPDEPKQSEIAARNSQGGNGSTGS